MLEQLVESKSNEAENKKRGGYLLTTFTLVVGLCFSAILWSLYAKDLGIGRGEFELSTILAPIPVNEIKPVPVQKQSKREQTQNTKSAAITRQANILRIDEQQPAPIAISVVPNTQKSRPNGNFLVKDGIENEPLDGSAGGSGRNRENVGVGILPSQTAQVETVEKTIPLPPPIKKPIAASAEKKTKPTSGGVINGKATSLPKPPYPPAAKAVGAGGNVNVQVTVDETGRVISAKALDGNILLRAAAEKAALSAKFDPTLLSKQPVKVTGIIVYRFAAQ